MNEVLVPIFTTLTVFGALFGILYVYYTTRNKERLALIEKGADAKLFQSEKKTNWINFALSLGMLIAGLGLGLVLAELINASNLNMDSAAVTAALILLCGGGGLIGYFFLVRKLKAKDKE